MAKSVKECLAKFQLGTEVESYLQAKVQPFLDKNISEQEAYSNAIREIQNETISSVEDVYRQIGLAGYEKAASAQQLKAAPIINVEANKPRVTVTAEQLEERQPTAVREKYLEQFSVPVDSKFDWTISSVLGATERAKAIKDIKEGKNTAPARKLNQEIQEAIDRGTIIINRGRGNAAETVEIHVSEWFKFTPIEQDRALKAADSADENALTIIRDNDITLQNIDDLKTLFNGFPYDQADFTEVKNYLSREGARSPEAARGSEQGEAIPQEKSLTAKGKDLAAKIRQLKTKRDTLQANIFGIPIAVYDGLLETIATAVENGALLADAIKSAIDSITDKRFDKAGFKKHVEDFMVGEKPRVKVQVGEENIKPPKPPKRNDGGEFEVSGDEMSGITHAQTEATRERFSLPLYDKNPETVDEWDAEADRLIYNGYNIEKLIF